MGVTASSDAAAAVHPPRRRSGVGWTSPWTVGFSVGATILLAAWALLELRTDHPLINLRVLRDRDVLVANGTAAGLGAAMPALIARTVAATELGSAVSFNQVLRTVGGSVGSAVSGAVLGAHLARDPHPTATGIGTALTLDAPASAAVSVTLVTNRVTAPHPPSVALESTRFDPPASEGGPSTSVKYNVRHHDRCTPARNLGA